MLLTDTAYLRIAERSDFFLSGAEDLLWLRLRLVLHFRWCVDCCDALHNLGLFDGGRLGLLYYYLFDCDGGCCLLLCLRLLVSEVVGLHLRPVSSQTIILLLRSLLRCFAVIERLALLRFTAGWCCLPLACLRLLLLLSFAAFLPLLAYLLLCLTGDYCDWLL